MTIWRRLPRATLESLAHALDQQRLPLEVTAAGVERYVGREHAGDVAADLGCLAQASFTPAQASMLLRAVATDHSPAATLQLVWSGPEGAGASSRDTGVVVPELFASARRSVLVAGYAISNGERVFAALAQNMDANPGLDVRIFTNIQRPWQDTRAESAIIRAFADDFRSRQWPGRRMPRILYDPRALAQTNGPRACLHAKCLIVDDERALITSANFTEAAMDRNIEAGVLIHDPAFASRLRAQFDALEQGQQVRSISVG